MNITDYLSAAHKNIVKEITSDLSIFICPADKGQEFVNEARDTYL